MSKSKYANLCFVVLILFFQNNFAEIFYSQYGQDKYLDEVIFRGKREGVFIEFGASDGIRFSNTYYFEKNLNWNGICIEPNPVLFPLLEKNRACICINGCITDFKGTSDFFLIHGYGVGLSGLLGKYDPGRVEVLKKEIAPYSSKSEVIEVECYSLNDILHEYGIFNIDYLSIDTEGGELDILKSIDFNVFFVDVISVEVHHRENNKIRSFLTEKGYSYLKTIGVDEIYRKN